ncbi:hypothetical protein ACQEV4_02965 [Streptomyces shenzhenensis]|uniref:hypothetical protein n=1 Tax=Streptomyces shenzhenensis TaxID=943815 RepID=UPI003D90BE4A
MGLFSRTTTDELHAEAKQTEANIASATRLQAAFGSSGVMGDDNVIAGYQHTLSQINQELKQRR